MKTHYTNDVVKHILCHNKSRLHRICMDCKQSNTNFRPFCKMAAISAIGQICDVPISKKSSFGYSVTVCQMLCFYRNKAQLFHISAVLTAKQRRQRVPAGCSRQGLGRPSKTRNAVHAYSLPQKQNAHLPRRKVPHSLAACISGNMSLGKTHSQKQMAK